MSGKTSENFTTSMNSVSENTIKKVLMEDKGCEAKLQSWVIDDFSKAGENNASSVWRVEVEYSIRGRILKTTYVAKVNLQRANSCKDYLNHCMFTKESLFYKNILPELNGILKTVSQPSMSIPQCFHSSLEMYKEQIYLEDLKRLGFKHFTNKEGLDIIHAKLILRELARLHASSLLLQHKYTEPLEMKHSFLLRNVFGHDDYYEIQTEIPILKNLSTSIEILQDNGGYEKAIIWIAELKNQIQDIFKNITKGEKFDVVCHGDCWHNNVLFKYGSDGSPTELLLIDFQNCRKVSLAEDLQYFMYTSVDPEVRRGKIPQFIHYYYTHFKEVMDAGGKNMPFTEEEVTAEFWDKRNIGAIFGLLHIPIQLFASAVAPDEGEMELGFVKMVEKTNEMAKLQVYSNPLFRKLFFSLIDELMETGAMS